MNEKEALLSELHDIELPLVSGGLAPGWWLLLLLCVCIAVVYWLLKKRHSRMLWKREAETELQSIRDSLSSEDSERVLSRSSALVRRVVLAVEPRQEVSALTGDAWLHKLDEISGSLSFSQGMGRLLAEHPYKPASKVSNDDLSALLDAIETLVHSAVKGRRAFNAAGVTAA